MLSVPKIFHRGARMNLLIIGGTAFLGRAVAEAALAAGHRVTLFHRGTTNPDLFPEAEHLVGDRAGDLSALEGRTWDAVVDTCGFVSADVRNTARALSGAVEHYTFVSSLSVYPNPPRGADESAEV